MNLTYFVFVDSYEKKVAVFGGDRWRVMPYREGMNPFRENLVHSVAILGMVVKLKVFEFNPELMANGVYLIVGNSSRSAPEVLNVGGVTKHEGTL